MSDGIVVADRAGAHGSVASLPITAFIALFTAIVLALLASYTMTGAAVPLYVVGIAAMTELRALVADIKAHPNRYASVHVF